MSKGNVLIVEDDLSTAQVITQILKKGDYKVRRLENADSAYAVLKEEDFDLILLDIEMPGISGLKLLEIIKQDKRTVSIPVIILSVRQEEAYKIQGLTIGADDYMIKPFQPGEFLARVEALLRRVRNAGQIGNVLNAGQICMDLDSSQVTVKGKTIVLTPAEFDILRVLMGHPGFMFSYRNLIENLSEGFKEMSSGNIHGHVKNLRKKLGHQGKAIENVYGTGYRFVKE